jgi:hypothetical protein
LARCLAELGSTVYPKGKLSAKAALTETKIRKKFHKRLKVYKGDIDIATTQGIDQSKTARAAAARIRENVKWDKQKEWIMAFVTMGISAAGKALAAG